MFQMVCAWAGNKRLRQDYYSKHQACSKQYACRKTPSKIYEPRSKEEEIEIGTTGFANGQEMVKPSRLITKRAEKRCNLEHEMCPEDGQGRVDGRIKHKQHGPRRGRDGPRRILEGLEGAQSSKTVVRKSQNQDLLPPETVRWPI